MSPVPPPMTTTGTPLPTLFWEPVPIDTPVSDLVDYRLLVVGDDPEQERVYAARLIADGNEVLDAPRLSDKPAINDFWLIARANNVVMSNSTFCWWATRVGDRFHSSAGHHRTVFAPAGWIGGAGRVILEPTWRPVESRTSIGRPGTRAVRELCRGATPAILVDRNRHRYALVSPRSSGAASSSSPTIHMENDD